MTKLSKPAGYGEWIDLTTDIAITKPAKWMVDGKDALRSWVAHRGSDGTNHGLARVVFGEGHHTLVSTDPLTIEPSLLLMCRPECGLHGFIRKGQWVSA